MPRWQWATAVAAVVVIGALLMWADSTLLRGLFPQPFGQPTGAEVRPAPLPAGPLPGGGLRRRLDFRGLGPVGGLFSFWWFAAAGAGVVLLVTGTVVAAPARVRRVAEGLQASQLPLMFAAGVAATLLVFALTELLRATFVLIALAPIVWAAAGIGVLFGIGALALAVGHRLQEGLGPANPLLAAAVAVLILFDVSLVPVAGWIALALIGLTALGSAVVTRFGSARGWSLEELHW